MKYTNESEETAVWVGLSIAWMLGGMLAWLFAVFSAQQPLAGGGLLTLLAVAASLISCALRLPILTDAPEQHVLSKHVVWLLGLVANMNWFGFLCLRSDSIAEVVPAGIIFVVGEMWLLPKAMRGDCLPWVCESLQRAEREMRARWQRPYGKHPLARGYDPSQVQVVAETANAIDSGGLSGGVQRRCTAGLDDEGRAYMSGEILVALESEQASDTVVIGFCPPFRGTPTLELEVTSLDSAEEFGEKFDEDPAEEFGEETAAEFGEETAEEFNRAEPDEVEARIVACTPQGARILVKRFPAHDATELSLGWFAWVDSLTEERHPEAAIPHRTPQTLP